MNPTEILLTISLAVSGWTLLEVIRLGKDVAVLKAQLNQPKENHELK